MCRPRARARARAPRAERGRGRGRLQSRILASLDNQDGRDSQDGKPNTRRKASTGRVALSACACIENRIRERPNSRLPRVRGHHAAAHHWRRLTHPARIRRHRRRVATTVHSLHSLRSLHSLHSLTPLTPPCALLAASATTRASGAKLVSHRDRRARPSLTPLIRIGNQCVNPRVR